MKLFTTIIAMVCLSVSSFAQLTNVTASHLDSDLGLGPLTAQLCLTPTLANHATAFSANGSAQVMPVQKCYPVTAGVLNISVPDTALANPPIGYKAVVEQSNGVNIYTFPELLFPTGDVWSFDSAAPTRTALVTTPSLQLSVNPPTGDCGSAIAFDQAGTIETGLSLYGCSAHQWALLQGSGGGGGTGPAGAAATINIGTVLTGAPGSSVTVTNAGTQSAAIFNFSIPAGATGEAGSTGQAGAAATISVGTVASGAAGSNPIVNNSGTQSAAVLNFTIPAGSQGLKGDTGAQGSAGSTGAVGNAATIAVGTVGTGAPGSSATVTNAGTSSAAVLNFSIPQGLKGDTGLTGSTGATGATGPAGIVSLTTTGTGAASLTGGVLNIPTFVGVSSINGSTGAFTFSGTGVTCTGTSCVFASSGGSMVFPSGSGIPVVVNGTSWGTTLAVPSGFAFMDATSSVQSQLNAKAATSSLATVATSGAYSDLSGKPTIPAAQVNSDWNAVSGIAQILNKPTLGTAAAQNTTAFDAAGAAASAQSAAEAASDPTGSASTAQTNAETFSANASNITSGTLPHAQLPALVSADIPANAANTSGSAASLSAASALPSGTTATTQTAGDNSTKVATTAYVATAVGTPISNVTATVGTTAIAANACGTAVTVTMTGVATTSTFAFTPNADVSGVTGWGSTGGLTIDAWPTVNTLNFKVCNQTAASITPSASVIFNVSAK